MGSKIINVSTASKSNEMKRKDVGMGQAFTAKGKKTVYAHMGERTVPPSNGVGYQSINTSNSEPAFTTNGDSNVTVVGTWKLNVELAEDYGHLA